MHAREPEKEHAQGDGDHEHRQPPHLPLHKDRGEYLIKHHEAEQERQRDRDGGEDRDRAAGAAPVVAVGTVTVHACSNSAAMIRNATAANLLTRLSFRILPPLEFGNDERRAWVRRRCALSAYTPDALRQA